MPIRQLNPYLNFNGDAEQAIRLYESALGAKVEGLMRFEEVKDFPCPVDQKKKVMHALLHVGGGVIMISDCPPEQKVQPTAALSVCLQFDDVDDMKRRFDALAAGGKVTMPVQDMFWGATFGMLTDRHGVSWMFNCEKKK